MFEVARVNTTKLRIFSLGIEESYTGKSIIYKDNMVVFIYFYYEELKRVYIVRTNTGNKTLPYCDGFVQILDKYDNHECRKLRREVKKIVKNTKPEKLCIFDDSFFLKLGILVRKHGKIYLEIDNLVAQYRNKYENSCY